MDACCEEHRIVASRGADQSTACRGEGGLAMLELAEQIDPRIDQAMIFAYNMLQGQSAAFYQVTSDLTARNFILRDVDPDFHRHYVEGMSQYDPLDIKRLARRTRPIARLCEEAAKVPRAAYAQYRSFSSCFGVDDMLEFVFRREGRIFAGMSVTWRGGQQIPDVPTPMADHIHAYLEFNLRDCDFERGSKPDQRMLDRFGLTPREVEVVELLRCGRTNQEIGECLAIGLATVKTHLVHIFCKLGVENRTAAVAFLARA
jgi:DNA-binding CsgD family transcriptional regulator